MDLVPINLALQGGGSHGAFTWGVLDRLLEQRELRFEGITGTSAGAMNAAAFASGYLSGGPDGARESLDRFWQHVGAIGRFSPIQRNPWDVAAGNFRLESSMTFRFFELFTSFVSPYQFNPMDIHPLRQVIEETLDLERIREDKRIKLFISATNVRTGKVRIFTNPEITAEVLLASACLPWLYKSVEIDGESYWDGGYVGNPALFPLIYNCESTDILVVQLNPLRRDEVPTTALEIQNRINEISFNATLTGEMRAIQFVTRLIEKGALDNSKYKKLKMHLIENENEIRRLGAASKLLAEPKFLQHLRDIGRETADAWLEKHALKIGVESSVQIKETYL